jgi:hypothetical protein
MMMMKCAGGDENDCIVAGFIRESFTQELEREKGKTI